ncbi:MAG TPA: protein kinase [Desulfomonilaceae bacterium]|nr:protein kinase [Desulfomonilaceae bacterium]
MVYEPTMFGRYCLIDQVSKGGMSDIFLAKTASVSGFQKALVIKKLLPQYSAKSRYVQRFVNEAKTLSRLNHTNIVQIIDMGVINSEYFIAMEYIEGRNIAHIISKAAKNGRRPSLEFILHVILEVAKGLGYAHRRKGVNGESLLLVHQDVNSFNVMVSYEGEVKIIDFGIARIFLDKTTRDGLPVAGKLLYFSPEQLQKKSLDRRVDIYGTGVMLYELITGERLVQHQATVNDTVKMILNMNVAERVGGDSRILPELKPVLIKAMALNPADRYPWMEDFIADVRKVIKKLSLDLDIAACTAYLREQFQREILLDRRRMRKLLSEDRSKADTLTALKIPQKDFVRKDEQGLLEGLLAIHADQSGDGKHEPPGEPVFKSIGFPAGKTIFSEGEPGSEVYIVRKGKVRLFLNIGDTKHVIGLVGESEFFGESCLLGEELRCLSAEADKDTDLLVIDREAFARLIGHGLPRAVVVGLLEKLRDAASLLESAFIKDSLSRLIFGLLFFQRRTVLLNGTDVNLTEVTDLFRLQNDSQMRRYLNKLQSLNILVADQDTVHIKNTEKLASILNVLSGRGKFMLKL